MSTIVEIGDNTIPNLGYKKCANNRIVELEPLGRNNEGRAGIVDSTYASMRCESARVIKIYDATTLKEVDEANSIHDISITYRKGQVVYPDSYDPDVDKVDTHGIHYFKGFEPADMFNLIKDKYTGEYRCWYPNGRLAEDSQYTDGRKYDDSIKYYSNGQLWTKCTYGYHIEEICGKYLEWDGTHKVI